MSRMLQSSVCRVLQSTQKSVLVRAPDPQPCPLLCWHHEVFSGTGGREDEVLEYFRGIGPRNSVPLLRDGVKTLASLSQTLHLVVLETVSTIARLWGMEPGSCHHRTQSVSGRGGQQTPPAEGSGFCAPYLTTLQNSIFVLTLDSALCT